LQMIKDKGSFQQICRVWRFSGLKTALVPTMGYFHQGHLSLMSYAKSAADKCIVSLFVNPTQFGPNEDLEAYPRDHERDAEAAERAGADLLFIPEHGDVYAPDHATWIEVPPLSAHLCGKSRPTHFRGVATIVAKLFNLATPSLAVFGQKDWQQLAIIKKMVRDLDMAVQVVGRPIIREEDGLAMSSRNAYLTPEERKAAPMLHQGLLEAQRLVERGVVQAREIIRGVSEFYAENLPQGELDYLELVDPDRIEPVQKVENQALLATAMRLGRARLIDNLLLSGTRA